MILWKFSTAISIKHRILATFNITKNQSERLYAFKQTYCYLLERLESLIWSVESSVFLYKIIFKSIFPLIPSITTNKFLLILLYKGHANTKTCDDIVTKKYEMCVNVSNCEPTVYVRVQSYLCICAKPEYVSIKENMFTSAESRFCVISGMFICTLISYAKST